MVALYLSLIGADLFDFKLTEDGSGDVLSGLSRFTSLRAPDMAMVRIPSVASSCSASTHFDFDFQVDFQVGVILRRIFDLCENSIIKNACAGSFDTDEAKALVIGISIGLDVGVQCSVHALKEGGMLLYPLETGLRDPDSGRSLPL
ncbi:hypothetical protein KCU61_g660, partial [Aureobasidium melanogenum]